MRSDDAAKEWARQTAKDKFHMQEANHVSQAFPVTSRDFFSAMEAAGQDPRQFKVALTEAKQHWASMYRHEEDAYRAALRRRELDLTVEDLS